MTFKCQYCQNEFPSQASLWGHSGFCRHVTKMEKNNLHEDNETNLNNNLEDIIFEDNDNAYDYTNDLGENDEHYRPNIDKKYYTFQLNFFKQNEFNNACHVKTSSGLFEIGNKYIYLKLLEYVVNTHGISDKSADDLIQCIKIMSMLNGKEIPLPSLFQRIIKILLDPIR